MKLSNVKDVALLAAIGYAIYFFKNKIAGPGGVADEWIARPIAYVISRWTLPPAAHIPGGVVLQDGGYIDWDAIIREGSKLSANGTFLWRRRMYKVLPRRADGNYPAVPA